MNIHNFVNRQLCEYRLIFPTVAALLDHLLFTNGNGYYFCSDIGMIVDRNRNRIDEYPEMTDLEWDTLIVACHEKERHFAEDLVTDYSPFNEKVFAAVCALYKRQTVDDSMFSTESLYLNLCTMSANLKERSEDSYLRPYPFSSGYADIYELNENTPKWFIQIALNFCLAWIQFLNEELINNNIWIKPSLRPKKEINLPIEEGMAELFKMIREDHSYDGWLDRPEPEYDYADLNFTTKYRDDLVEIVKKLNTML